MWYDLQIQASKMKKCRLNTAKIPELTMQLWTRWTPTKLLCKSILKNHPYASADMATHTKMNIYDTLCVVFRVARQIHKQPCHKKDDIFGDGTNWSIDQLYQRVIRLIEMDNGWHAGALCSHLLAIVSSKGYRKQWGWMHRHQLHHMCINDYIKIAKKAHEIIRRTGID